MYYIKTQLLARLHLKECQMIFSFLEANKRVLDCVLEICLKRHNWGGLACFPTIFIIMIFCILKTFTSKWNFSTQNKVYIYIQLFSSYILKKVTLNCFLKLLIFFTFFNWLYLIIFNLKVLEQIQLQIYNSKRITKELTFITNKI